MSDLELIAGRTYRAKKPSSAGSIFDSYFNDRTVLWVSPNGQQIQYDGPAVKIGSRRPIISREKFLKWASHDVTDSLPEGEYEPFYKKET